METFMKVYFWSDRIKNVLISVWLYLSSCSLVRTTVVCSFYWLKYTYMYIHVLTFLYNCIHLNVLITKRQGPKSFLCNKRNSLYPSSQYIIKSQELKSLYCKHQFIWACSLKPGSVLYWKFLNFLFHMKRQLKDTWRSEYMMKLMPESMLGYLGLIMIFFLQEFALKAVLSTTSIFYR